jgi:hypothetical protein
VDTNNALRERNAADQAATLDAATSALVVAGGVRTSQLGNYQLGTMQLAGTWWFLVPITPHKVCVSAGAFRLYDVSAAAESC